MGRRGVHPLSLSQVFLKHTVMRMSKSNYSPIKDKDVTWEGAATQRLAMQRRARAKCAHRILQLQRDES